MSDTADRSPVFSGKRIALFLDGTWNTEGDNTNVWRLKSICKKADDKGNRQLVFYDEGVGTRLLEEVRGGPLGTRGESVSMPWHPTQPPLPLSRLKTSSPLTASV